MPKEPMRRGRAETCQFCNDETPWIDYKDISLLKKYVSDRGKIRARRVTGTCMRHQREIAVAVKTARELMLLPYTERVIGLERPPSRGRRDSNYDGDMDEESRLADLAKAYEIPEEEDEYEDVPSEGIEGEV
ncbi:MAG: 30S ribosomal protein S18 [Acidimicrobiales bacterium]|nr:30S ribosomal protein S18 [Acidimicrobiales bacterium]